MQRGSGLVDLEELEAAVRPDTVACSVMAVNNEIGVVQPLKEIGEICRKNKVFFHSDIAQMLGKVCSIGRYIDWSVYKLVGWVLSIGRSVGGLVRRSKLYLHKKKCLFFFFWHLVSCALLFFGGYAFWHFSS